MNPLILHIEEVKTLQLKNLPQITLIGGRFRIDFWVFYTLNLEYLTVMMNCKKKELLYTSNQKRFIWISYAETHEFNGIRDCTLTTWGMFPYPSGGWFSLNKYYVKNKLQLNKNDSFLFFYICAITAYD